MSALTRIVTALAAIAVMVPLAAWLSTDLLQARADRVLTASTASPPERLDRAESLLGDAADRTPSAAPELMLAQAQIFGRRPAAAAAVLDDVVRREPDNAAAWELLAIATERVAPERSRRARARFDQLSPAVGG